MLNDEHIAYQGCKLLRNSHDIFANVDIKSGIVILSRDSSKHMNQ